MKILEIVQKHYATMGIMSSEKYPLNKRILAVFSIFGCGVVSLGVEFFHVSNHLMESIICLCLMFGVIITFNCFAAIVFKRSLLFENINKIETLIDTSERCASF